MNSRRILHLDLDAFFCAVEEIQNPNLRGKAFAVGGSPDGRGVVSSCSYPARRFGIHSAMPMARAVQLCPELIILPGNHQLYGLYSRRVMGVLRELTDQVEQISIDEAFLDISDLPDPPRDTGFCLQSAILDEVGLPNSVGIASNKLVAKIATDVGKLSSSGDAPPNALTIVPPGEEARFLAPLPVKMLWGVGPKTADRLAGLGIETVGELAAVPPLKLADLLGKHGYDLSKRARGIDERPIMTERETKSVSNERTFRRDLGRKTDILQHLGRLSSKVSQRLQAKNLQGRTIQIKVRWSDFTTLTRQTTLPRSTADRELIQRTSEKLFNQVWEQGRLVRLVGVGVSNLDPEVKQLGLWDPGVREDQQLNEALQQLREKYGEDVIRRGFSRE
jgi:DNA polymerase-4